ncbi:MAG: tautomerase family protein [Candidatus Latescibacterota bacterium]
MVGRWAVSQQPDPAGSDDDQGLRHTGRAHRFFPMDRQDFWYAAGRSEAYTVIEIALMQGRSTEARKRLIHLLFERLESELGISPMDVEITITETPPGNWGFRGTTGDEAGLSYRLDV